LRQPTQQITFFGLPGELRLAVPEVLPDDLPPEWLGVFLGFAFKRRGILSVREERRLDRIASTVLEHWQATHYPSRELSRNQASRITARLAGMRRLLSKKSLFAYLSKATREVWTSGQ